MEYTDGAHLDEFQALTASIGEHLVRYIGKERLISLRVLGDQDYGTVDVTVRLRDNSWSSRTAAIRKIIQVRSLFLDEASIRYVIRDDRRRRGWHLRHVRAIMRRPRGHRHGLVL